MTSGYRTSPGSQASTSFKENVVSARLNRFRPLVAAWIIAGALALLSAAAVLAQTPYPH
jgi:hypothetical protein